MAFYNPDKRQIRNGERVYVSARLRWSTSKFFSPPVLCMHGFGRHSRHGYKTIIHEPWLSLQGMSHKLFDISQGGTEYFHPLPFQVWTVVHNVDTALSQTCKLMGPLLPSGSSQSFPRDSISKSLWNVVMERCAPATLQKILKRAISSNFALKFLPLCRAVYCSFEQA